MPAPHNRFKQRLRTHTRQIGAWVGMCDPYAAEITAQAGFDWLLVDSEHAPNDLNRLMRQLQVIDPSPSDAIVRLPMDESWAIKQVLDAGAQSLLIPMVESAEQARRIVAATRYPPQGVRGVGAALARASRFGAIPDYIATADTQIAVVVQIETRKGLDAIEEIAAVEGVDGLFVGPADLSADLGYPGQPDAPEAAAAIVGALRRIRTTGKAAGVLTTDRALGRIHEDAGASFIGAAIDVCCFADALRGAAAAWRDAP